MVICHFAWMHSVMHSCLKLGFSIGLALMQGKEKKNLQMKFVMQLATSLQMRNCGFCILMFESFPCRVVVFFEICFAGLKSL